MKLKLSSNSTLFMRNRFPYVWVAIPVITTLALLVSGSSEAWSVLLFTVCGGLFVFWISRLLYETSFDENNLYISNGSIEISTPLSNIKKSDIVWSKNMAHFEFYEPIEYGSKVYFYPRFSLRFKNSKLSRKLRERLKKAT